MLYGLGYEFRYGYVFRVGPMKPLNKGVFTQQKLLLFISFQSSNSGTKYKCRRHIPHPYLFVKCLLHLPDLFWRVHLHRFWAIPFTIVAEFDKYVLFLLFQFVRTVLADFLTTFRTPSSFKLHWKRNCWRLRYLAAICFEMLIL